MTKQRNITSRDSKLRRAMQQALLDKPAAPAPVDVEPVWKTKEGVKLPIAKMDDKHLLCCIQWMERKAREAAGAILGLATTPDLLVSRMFPVYPLMVEEMKRRLEAATTPDLEAKQRRVIKLDE